MELVFVFRSLTTTLYYLPGKWVCWSFLARLHSCGQHLILRKEVLWKESPDHPAPSSHWCCEGWDPWHLRVEMESVMGWFCCCCCCSVAKWGPTLCDPVHYNMPGSPVLHYLSSGVCSDSYSLSWWCYPTISSSIANISFCLQSFSASGSIPMSWLFSSGGQSIEAFASVLPMNIQGWFP